MLIFWLEFFHSSPSRCTFSITLKSHILLYSLDQVCIDLPFVLTLTQILLLLTGATINYVVDVQTAWDYLPTSCPQLLPPSTFYEYPNLSHLPMYCNHLSDLSYWLIHAYIFLAYCILQDHDICKGIFYLATYLKYMSPTLINCEFQLTLILRFVCKNSFTTLRNYFKI